jgi:nitroimidazol reductase NimA-like FMN-containing flavoprotein (pyridoxamine 5'-phosphate oxidase superfamily)
MSGQTPITELSTERCWALLEANPMGRLAAAAAGEVDIFPINYIVDAGTLVFRTAPGTKLVELTIHSSVALEIDGYSETEAWSVVVKGRAAAVESRREADALERLPLTPWIPTPKFVFVRITPTEVSGRRFVRGPEPDRSPY